LFGAAKIGIFPFWKGGYLKFQTLRALKIISLLELYAGINGEFFLDQSRIAEIKLH